MRDLIGYKPNETFDDFNRIYWLPPSIRGNNVRANIMKTAYKALVALERGRREEYLAHRRQLALAKWHRSDRVNLKFYRLDVTWSLAWTDVMVSSLSASALANGYEAEESSWETINPGRSRLERMLTTELTWNNSMQYKGAWFYRPVIEMMDLRISDVIATGSKKQPLISMLLDCRTGLRERYEQAHAKYEMERLQAALRRQRRESQLAATIRGQAEAEAPKALSSDAEIPVVRPVGPMRV